MLSNVAILIQMNRQFTAHTRSLELLTKQTSKQPGHWLSLESKHPSPNSLVPPFLSSLFPCPHICWCLFSPKHPPNCLIPPSFLSVSLSPYSLMSFSFVKNKKRKNGSWLPFFVFIYKPKWQKEKWKLTSVFPFFIFVYIQNDKRKNGSDFRFLFSFTHKTKKGKTEVDFRFSVFCFHLHTKRQKEKRKFDFRFSFRLTVFAKKEIVFWFSSKFRTFGCFSWTETVVYSAKMWKCRKGYVGIQNSLIVWDI